VAADIDTDLLAEIESDSDGTSARLARMRRQRDQAANELARKCDALAEAERMLDLHDRCASADMVPPKWLTPKRAKTSHATACGILSDTHFDEVVFPAEIGGVNAYNREIAELRLRRWADRFVTIARDYLAGLEWDGAVVMLGGDIFSGNLHDLAETNEDTLFGSVVHWAEQIAAALTVIVDDFGKLHVPCVVGNHGRLTRKPRTKKRARDNADWLLAKMVAQHFAGDDRVTFDIPDSADCTVRIYDTVMLLTHGDQVSGGGGIGGIWPPIMRMVARKRATWAGQGATFDCVVMGHWHQLIAAPTSGLIVNGSTKGYDEYAALQGFSFEKPQQAFWVTTPEHGITFTAPILCTHPKEKW
jgi:hypothetical protein